MKPSPASSPRRSGGAKPSTMSRPGSVKDSEPPPVESKHVHRNDHPSSAVQASALLNNKRSSRASKRKNLRIYENRLKRAVNRAHQTKSQHPTSSTQPPAVKLSWKNLLKPSTPVT